MIVAISGGIRITVHVVPGAGSDGIAGVHGDAIKVRLAAQPVDGRANEALLGFLAKMFGVVTRQVTLLRGASSRRKTVDVLGISLPDARARLGLD